MNFSKFIEFIIYNPFRNLGCVSIILVSLGCMALLDFKIAGVLIVSGIAVALMCIIQGGIAGDHGYEMKDGHKDVKWKW